MREANLNRMALVKAEGLIVVVEAALKLKNVGRVEIQRRKDRMQTSVKSRCSI